MAPATKVVLAEERTALLPPDKLTGDSVGGAPVAGASVPGAGASVAGASVPGAGASVAGAGASVAGGQALQTGQPDLLFLLLDPHGHGEQEACTGGSGALVSGAGASVAGAGASVAGGQALQTGQPDLLFLLLEPHGHGEHEACTGGSVAGASVAGALVTGASVAGASVAGASVAGASVAGASVAGASVAGASVAGASVAGASVAGASVAGASVAGASVAGASVGHTAHCGHSSVRLFLDTTPHGHGGQVTCTGGSVGGASVGGASVGGASVGGGQTAQVGQTGPLRLFLPTTPHGHGGQVTSTGGSVGGASVGGASVGGASVGGASVGGASVGGAHVAHCGHSSVRLFRETTPHGHGGQVTCTGGSVGGASVGGASVGGASVGAAVDGAGVSPDLRIRAAKTMPMMASNRINVTALMLMFCLVQKKFLASIYAVVIGQLKSMTALILSFLQT